MHEVTTYTKHEPIINQIERPGAERNVLAIILNDPDKIYDVASDLREEDFNNTINQFLYRVMLRLSERGVAVTIPNILAVAKSSDSLGKSGEEYLRRISMANTSNISLDYNIQLVKVASIKRRAYKEALNVIQDCLDDKKNIDDVNTLVGKQQQRFMDLSIQTGDRVVQIGEGIDEWLENVLSNPDPIPGLRSGFDELDKEIGGFRPGRAYLFTARSKHRKSILLNNFSIHIAVKQQMPILYIDTEMETFEDVRPRLWAILSGVDEEEIVTGMYQSDPVKADRVELAKELLRNAPFYHGYIPNYNLPQVVSLVRKHHIKHGIKALFFDYIKMPQENSKLQEYQLLGQILGGLKDLAGELQIPLITAAQLNRSGIGITEKSAEPDTSMIGASDRLLHNTSYLFYLWHKSPERIIEDGGEDAGNMCLMLGESRHGGDYFGWLKAHPRNARIIEVQKL